MAKKKAAAPPPAGAGAADSRVQQVMRENIVNQFAYHTPTGGKQDKHERVRAACRDAALAIIADVPISAELTTALDCLRAAMMWANAGIACHAEPPPPVENAAPWVSTSSPPPETLAHDDGGYTSPHE